MLSQTSSKSFQIYKKCSNCLGRGYNNRNKNRYKWNYLTKKNQLEFYTQQEKCDNCSGNGKVLDKQATQKKRQQYLKQQKYQQFLNKEKKFEQYFKENQLNKRLLQDIQDDSQQNQSNRWSKIQRQSILSAQRSKGIIYCGVCAGTGYQRKYLSQQVNICSNCKGSGKMNFNQQNQPLLVLLKPQLKNNKEPKAKMDESKDKLIFCGTCAGKGYEKVYMSDEIRKCQNCDGMGKLALDPNDFPQKLKYQGYQNQAKKLQQNYKKAKQKQLKKTKQNQKIQRKIKTQAQLRAQFQRKYAEQQQQARRLQSQRKWQQENRKGAQRIEIQQKQRKEREKREKQWQERKKTPQGMKQWQRIQNRIKSNKRKQRCRDCMKSAVKIICCGGPSCGRVSIWCGVFLLIGFWIFLWMLVTKSRQ